MIDATLLDPIEAIATNTRETSSFLDDMINCLAAAAILQEAGRLAGSGPISPDHLQQAQQAYLDAKSFYEKE